MKNYYRRGLKIRRSAISLLILVYLVLLFNIDYNFTNGNKIKYDGVGMLISSDEDFLLYSRSGNGSQENPYVISGYTFEYNIKGISISQTTKHFIITNCSFFNIQYEAIWIWFVESGTARVENNTITNANLGIFLYEAPNGIIANNKVINCSLSGIRTEFSEVSPKIYNNTLYNNEEGITIYKTNYSQIFENYIIKSNRVSILLAWKANNSEIHNNFILNDARPYLATAHDEGFNNNWTSNYWSDWNGTGFYQLNSRYGAVFDNHPLKFVDTDGDKIIDILELVMGMNPNTIDSDSDKINDYDELLIYVTNPNIVDTDGDGITDYDEIFVFNTNPNIVDTDGDGLSDYDELFNYNTDPNNQDTDGDTFSDYEEIIMKTNPRKSYSNPITKKYVLIFTPVLSGIIGLLFLSTRYYTNSRRNKIKVIFETWNEFFDEWEKIIEQINNTKSSEVEEIIFEVKELKNKKIDELELVKNIIGQAKKLLINHMKFNVELSLQRYKKQAEIFYNLQSNLISQALTALNQITKNTILNAVKDYLWMRFVYLYSTTEKSGAIATIEDISGDSLFNKFVKFYNSLDYEEKLKDEVSRLVEEIKYQMKKAKDYEIDLLESSINSIIESLFDKFSNLEIDVNVLQEKIKDISVEQTKLDHPEDAFLKLEKIVIEEVKEKKELEEYNKTLYRGNMD